MTATFDEILNNPKLDSNDIVTLYLSLKEFDNPNIIIDEEFRDNKFVGCYDVDNGDYKVEIYKDTFYLYGDEHRKEFIDFLEMCYDFSDLKNIKHKTNTTAYAIVHTSIDMYDHTVNNSVDSVYSDKSIAEEKLKELDNSAWRDESIHYFKIVKVPFYK